MSSRKKQMPQNRMQELLSGDQNGSPPKSPSSNQPNQPTRKERSSSATTLDWRYNNDDRVKRTYSLAREVINQLDRTYLELRLQYPKLSMVEKSDIAEVALRFVLSDIATNDESLFLDELERILE